MITQKLNLAALKHVKMEMPGESGKVKGLFIPISANQLFEGKDGAVYLDLIAFEMKEPKDTATHIIKQSFSKDVRDKMTEDEKKALPILGNAKIGGSASSTPSNNAASDEVFTPTSVIPF